MLKNTVTQMLTTCEWADCPEPVELTIRDIYSLDPNPPTIRICHQHVHLAMKELNK